MNKFFSSKPIFQSCGIAALRIITGIFLVYHGCEMFSPAAMKEYAGWDMFKDNSNPLLMPYIGKAFELAAGILLTIGLFTRVACIIIAGTMLYIAFFIGHGKIWYEDQYPFLFALLACVFFFTGPGSLSLDKVLFDKGHSKES